MAIDFNHQKSTSAYNYATPPRWAAELKEAYNLSEKCSPRVLLDLGCGPGRFLPDLKKEFNCKLIGMDSATPMINLAAKNLKDIDFQLIQADALYIPLKTKSIDLVLARYILHHINDKLTMLREIERILSDSGVCIFETADIKQLELKQVYKDFPDIGTADLKRWPSLENLRGLFNETNIHYTGSRPIRLIRDTVKKNDYIERLIAWESEGGGTSFWSAFSKHQRNTYVRKELTRLDSMSEVEILTESVFIVGRKTSD